MNFVHKLLSIFVLLSLLASMACATGTKTVWNDEPKSDAEAAYREAVRSLERGAFEDATKGFNNLKLQYPYATRWATLAELRIADTYYESAEYPVAAISYQDFVKTFPTHAEVAYAMFRIAKCYDKMMPSEFFILPDSWQRERKTVQQAKKAYSSFLAKYPNNENAPEAQTRLQAIQTRLVNHELYVAEYYFKRESYIGSVNRLNNLISEYPNAELTPKAYVLLAHSYIKLADPIAAKQTLQNLIQRFPDSEYIVEAQAWLEQNPEVPDSW